MTRGKTFIVSGPSGVGKSTVLKALMEKRKNLYFSISATTREARPGEIDGVHYHFISVDDFRDWISRDEFLEYAEYVGNFYGTPKKYVDAAMDRGDDVILDIEVQGTLQVCAKRPETVRIFIAPPSWEELERRLTGRGTNTPEDIQSRLRRAKAAGYPWVAVLGGSYYARFGFEPCAPYGITVSEDAFANEHLQILFFQEEAKAQAAGRITYCDAFYDGDGNLL